MLLKLTTFFFIAFSVALPFINAIPITDNNDALIKHAEKTTTDPDLVFVYDKRSDEATSDNSDIFFVYDKRSDEATGDNSDIIFVYDRRVDN